MKDRIHKRFITALLCATMTVCLLPVVNAMETDNSQVQTNAGITEVVDLREETVKHFDMGDGTYRAVQYGRAVHRLDSEGKWQDIDNSLSLTSTKGVQTYTSQDQRTSFAPVYTANQPLFTLSEDGTAVSLSLLANTVNSGTVTMSASEEVLSPAVVTNSEQMQLAADAGDFDAAAAVNITSSVLYENVLPNTDLEYVLDGNDVKENIIVNAKADSYSYRFSLDLDGLYPELLDSGSIILYDAVSNQEQYLIPAPFMYDANDILSEAVTYQLNHSGGKYYLTVTADAAWINDDERVFPVVIDPTVQAVIDTNAFHDTFISSAYPSTTYGSYSKLWVTRDPSMYVDSMIYLKPFLPELPDGSKVTDAEMALSYYYNDYCTSNFMQISAHYVTSSWTESGLTWNNASELTNYGMSSAYIGIYYAFGAVGKYSSPGLIYIPLAVDKVNNWYNGVDDYGIGLKCHGGKNYSVIISSYEEVKSTHRPCVTVTYEPPKMLEDGVYWIKNVSNSKYMTTANGGYSAGTVLQQSAKATGTDVIRNQLYKVEYLSSDSGKYTYSIRPLTNCAMGLSGTSASGNATLQDYSPASSQRWYITDTGDYYTIQNKAIGSEGYLSSPSNSTNGSTLTFTSGSISRSKWVFEEYTGSVIEGLIWINTINSLPLRNSNNSLNSYIFRADMYSTVLDEDRSVVYSVTDSYGASTTIASINSITGELTVRESGAVIVRAAFPEMGTSISCDVQIIGTGYKCRVTHYYDQGFLLRNSNSEFKLRQYHEEVSKIYYDIFGLEIAGDFIQFESLGDECRINQHGSVMSQYLDDPCPNGAKCESPSCMTTGNFRSHLIEKADVILARFKEMHLLWTGHRMANDAGDRSCAHDISHVSVLTPFATAPYDEEKGSSIELSDSEKYDLNVYAYLHEFGHLLGTNDHYCYQDNELGNCSNVNCDECRGPGETRKCAMSDLKNLTELGNSPIFCDECVQIIRARMDEYFEE